MTDDSSKKIGEHTDPEHKELSKGRNADISSEKKADNTAQSSTAGQSESPPFTTPKTIKLNRPPDQDKDDTSGMAEAPTVTRGLKSSDTAGDEAKTHTKKETSRIKLEDVGVESVSEEDKKSTSEIPDSEAPTAKRVPETIRLKRPTDLHISGKPAVPVTGLTSEGKDEKAAPSMSEAHTAVRERALKSTTSRIIIEDYAEVEAVGEPKSKTSAVPPTTGPVPQTIKLKRPSGAVAAVIPATIHVGDQKVAPAKKAETAKIEMPEQEFPQVPITQRKTIKIKRTERAVTPRTVAIARPAVEVSKESVEYAVGEEAPKDIGLFYSIVVVATVLIVAGLVYIIVAQAFGPELILPIPSQLL